MKKSLWIVLLIGICLVLTFPFSVSGKPITLTLSTQNPETGWGQVNALKPWVDQIEKAAKGNLKIKVYYSQTLNKGPDTWKAVKDGIADMGWCFHAYWPGMTSLSDVISLPACLSAHPKRRAGRFGNFMRSFPPCESSTKTTTSFSCIPRSLFPDHIEETGQDPGRPQRSEDKDDGRSFH